MARANGWRSMWSWRMVWMLVGIAGCGFVMLELVRPHQNAPAIAAETRKPTHAEPVRLLLDNRIEVTHGSLLESKLTVVPVSQEEVSYPVLTVTGSVIARFDDETEFDWNFSSPDLLANYISYLKTDTEVAFAEQQVAKVRQLSEASVKSHQKIVARLKQLVVSGTDAPKDLAAAETELAHAELQGQKDVFEAESALKVAKASQTALARQLWQAGLNPSLLKSAVDNTVIVVAEVPEAKIAVVTEGQACDARFYSFPGIHFPAVVGKPAPSLSSERRTLRVPFVLQDGNDHLKPGMFAEIGLGTEPRGALLAPTTGVLHVGRCDYILVETEPGVTRVAEVQVGEPHGTKIEILSGLQPSDRIVGSGAILLKPFVVQALQQD